MWLGWNPSRARVDILELATQFMHGKIVSLEHNVSFVVTFVYGFHTMATRVPLWKDFDRIGKHMGESWVLMGDFNTVFAIDHRINGKDVSEQEIRDGLDWLNELQLGFVRSVGQFYSWIGGGNIHRRIDHCIANG